MKPFQFAPGIGHNGAASKADCIAAIEVWTKTRRVADALSVEELGELDPGAKLIARERFELEAIRHVLLKHPRESALLGVLKAISFLSDDRGYCDISQDRLARFFGRGREHINNCIKALRQEGLIRVESIGGKPSRLSPVIARIFAEESIHRTWFFDAFAPCEPAKPGRKPKAHGEIPVADTATPIFEIPVATTPTPISKYLWPKTEIPVATTATQISYESPVVEEEINTPRANGCVFEGLLAGSVQAPEPELFNANEAPASLPSKAHLQRWEEITRRWGRSPAEELPPRDKPDFKVGQWLKSDVKALGFGLKYEPEIINAALEATLSAMEACTMDEPTAASVKGAKPAKNYFSKQFPSDLARLRKIEHDARVDAKKVETLAEDEVIIKRAANEKASEKKLAALDRGIAQNEQKRIEAGAHVSKANGAPDGRFNDADKRVTEIAGHIISGPDANAILDAVPGSTPAQVRTALREISDKFRKPDGKPYAFGSPADVSAKGVHNAAIRYLREQERKRADEALKDKHGKPEAFCGGTPHPDFKSNWFCLSQEFILALKQKCPNLKAEETREQESWEYKCERGLVAELKKKFPDLCEKIESNHEDYGNGLQQRVEAEIKKAMLEREDSFQKRSEANKIYLARDAARKRGVIGL